jgi:predicted secreted Zn-dependent protease
VTAMLRFAFLLAALLPLPALAADWAPREVTKHYAVTGTTGIALYESIGENGPEIGKGLVRRTIAVTEYDLKWRRDYQPRDGGCTLASAVPILTITYRLPKPKGRLPEALAARWQEFADGIAAHERVHGMHIVEMVEAIIRQTVGLSVAGDSGCKAIRSAVLDRVRAEVEAYKARARAFDAVEMAKDGNVQRLILSLVNGG